MSWLSRDAFMAWVRDHGLVLEHSPSADGHHHVRAADGSLLNGSINLRRRDVPAASIAQIRRKARKRGIELPNPRAER